MSLMTIDLTDIQFKKISRLVYQLCGINLKEGKEALVRSRLIKRLRALGMKSFEDYMKFVQSDQGADELGLMIDVLTTNKTSFFREEAHFDYLRNNILPELRGKILRLWCAACSSGEEPFSLAMIIRENLQDIESRDVKILATDISKRMLDKAREGIYEEEKIQGISPQFLKKYFVRARRESPYTYKVKDNVRTMVRVARLNLMDKWPMKGPFNLIFCRNVMIYFDRTTQQKLIGRFWNLLEPGGHLFVGHSEGLSAISHKFSYIMPAIYRK